MVIANMSIPCSQKVQRTVYDYRMADWPALEDRLLETDWEALAKDRDGSTATAFTECLLQEAGKCIPTRV